jgi:hypothetical protein
MMEIVRSGVAVRRVTVPGRKDDQGGDEEEGEEHGREREAL